MRRLKYWLTVRRLAYIAAILAWAVLLVSEVLPDLNQTTQGFTAYYAAAYAVLHGGAADLNNNQAFGWWVARTGSRIHEVFAGNAPTLSLVMIPLTVVNLRIAQTVWLILNVGMLAVSAWLAGRLCAPRNFTARWWIAAVFALLAPVLEVIRYGQVYLLLALLSLLIIMFLPRYPLLVGIALAGMVLLKPYYGVLTLGVLVWLRCPRSILTAITLIGLVVISTLPLLAGAWPGFLQAQASINDIAWAAIPANQTLNSFFQHLLLYSPIWNPEPLANIPLLAIGLRYAFSMVLVLVTLRQANQHGDDPFWIWIPALTLMPVLAPVGEAHHYAMLLFPIAVGVTRLVERNTSKVTMGVIGGALFLLIVPWPSLHDPANWGGWGGLFAYPRLMGALLLWAVLVLKDRSYLRVLSTV
ncbi:MAG: glycosyltransferase family 87 protein [Chloroflexota bacterium]